MTWIKICGITNLEDALTAVDAGADAVGFVFYEKSPRRIEPQTVREIVSQLPQEVEKVGVFVNKFEDAICDCAEKAGLTMVQFHGDNEDPHAADLIVRRRSDLKVLVGISMLDPVPEGSAMMWSPDSVHAYLVDSGESSHRGGTGKTFDWEQGRKSVDAIKSLGRVVVAGGLNSENVTRPLRILHPWGVDVSSGVEAQPGKKDPEKVRAFVQAVRAAEKGA
jgi:phosphoribosylanthranilate isomerase